jgi:type VI secretion system protein ImpG
MDSRLLRYYTEELSFLRETAAEFAKEYPKIAGRLALDSFECADPYVERLLEGVAFLTARIQLRMTSEYPQFTSHLMELLFPNFLAPIPSMAVVEFQPDLQQGSLASGFTVPKHSTLRGQLSKGEQTRCTFRTGHPVTMWPIQLVEA